MRTVEETKKILNVLIKNDKKHLKFFDAKFNEYEQAKKDNAELYFVVENRNYLVTQYYELKYDLEKSQKNSKNVVEQKPSFETYFLRLLNAFLDFEDNDCTSWILDNYEYLKNRVSQIYANNKTCHLYQFKYVEVVPNNPNNQFIEL
ncbi:hypothetical protein D8X55_03970 [Malacoplasma penetrans]|uniref:Uncharacterized protein n=1 Tax=Malacoplasma penetrans (strain HF-2) TaxID=272633 RepID=Q8EW39_MALP2|nr:hypothetical protein [Malacoplasma penetrans]RXY96379.1 hypothetical protein D8X55_03970 [Malacoplasma penetrans]BAC44157.1 hypothetical protein [Malacoplasma penetrans HF-2]